MATSSPGFRSETASIHNDHLFLARLLDKFEASLSRLNHESAVDAQRAELASLTHLAQVLADEMPHHCRREEDTLFASASAVSEELAEFCIEMKREHGASLEFLADFRAALEALQATQDLAATLPHLIEQGIQLSESLRGHVAREESELSGFL